MSFCILMFKSYTQSSRKNGLNVQDYDYISNTIITLVLRNIFNSRIGSIGAPKVGLDQTDFLKLF